MNPSMRIKNRARQNLHDALRDNRFSTYPSRKVRFRGESVEVSEQEYQWLNLRGHLRGESVVDTDCLRVAP